MIASSSAITTRTGLVTGVVPLTYRLRRGGRSPRERQLAGHAVEERVLIALELLDGAAHRVALARLCIGVAAHLVRLGLGQRCLRHEGPQARVLRLGDQDRALLVGDGQLGAEALETIAHVDEPA